MRRLIAAACAAALMAGAAGLALAIPGFALIGLSRHPLVLFAGVGLMGVGTGFAQPSITALASLYAPADRQGGMMAIASSMTLLGNLLGPVIGGVIAGTFGITTSFIANSCMLVFMSLMIWKYLGPDSAQAPASVPGADSVSPTE